MASQQPQRLVLPAPARSDPAPPSAPPAASAAPSTLALAEDLRVVTRGRTGVQATFSAIVPAGPQIVQTRPGAVDVEATTSRTANALAKIVNLKVAANSVSVLPQQQDVKGSYIKLNGATDPVTGKTTKERMIRMVEKRVDPLEPAKFKFRAAPKGPGSPPVPVLHSPSKKPTEEELKDWTIPPTVSNWKNPKGFTISLDKRMAAAGETETPEVNDNFAKVAEALLMAEERARTQVSMRAKLRQAQEDKAKELENENLRIKAAEARAARMGHASAAASSAAAMASPAAAAAEGSSSYGASNAYDDDANREGAGNTPPMMRGGDTPPLRNAAPKRRGENEDDDEGRRRRDVQRRELEKEIERDLRLEAAGKRTKLSREQDRDVSERVALGLPVPKGASLEGQFDARLFNQGRGGIAAGHGNDDDDLAFSGPLFKSVDEHIYKPSNEVRKGDQSAAAASKLEELKSSERFQPAFKGSEGGSASASSGQRAGPVKFERNNIDPITGLPLSSVHNKAASVLEGLGARAPTTMSSRASGGIEGRLLGARGDDEDDPTGEYAQTAQVGKSSSKRSMNFVKASE